MTSPEDLVRHHHVTVYNRRTIHEVELPFGQMPEELGAFMRDGVTQCGEDARGMSVAGHEVDFMGREWCPRCFPPPPRPWWVRLLDRVTS